MRRFVAILPLVLLALSSCAERTTTPERTAHEIESRVWSPYCPGRLLIDCTTAQARELRGEIAERAERGDDSGEILRWVRSEYGDAAIAQPDVRGRGLLLWLTPAVAFLLGAVVVAMVVRRSRRGPRDDGPIPARPTGSSSVRDEVRRDL